MRKPKKRKINAARIRQNRTYDRREISKALAVHKNTISHWVREGLCPLDNQKPELFHGSEIARFIRQRQQISKTICAKNEMYCLKCRAPRKALIGSVSIEQPNAKTANLVGKCQVCSTTMNRRISLQRIGIFEDAFGIRKRQFSHLIEPQFNSLNCAKTSTDLADLKHAQTKAKIAANLNSFEQFNLFET